MLLSTWEKSGLDSRFKEVRVFKVVDCNFSLGGGLLRSFALVEVQTLAVVPELWFGCPPLRKLFCEKLGKFLQTLGGLSANAASSRRKRNSIANAAI